MMKKVLNIIGYISLLSLPYMVLIFILVFHDLVKIFILISLLMIFVFQIWHYHKTKIKYYGIRILVTIILVIIFSLIIYYGYGIIKNNEARKLAKTIEKISFETYELDQSKLENNLKFVNTKDLIFKGSSDAIIYYTDGRIERTKVYYSGFYIIQIKDDKYYILNN